MVSLLNMLRITVELVPFGDESNTRKIGEMVIANTGRVGELNSYEGWTAEDEHSGEPAMFGRVNFDRRQSVWELVRLMVESIRLEKHEPYQDLDSVSQRLLKRLGGGK